MTFCNLTNIQWQSPTDQTLYRTRPFTEFWVVSIEHLRRVWHADRGRLLSPDTWSFPIWDLHLFLKPKPHYLLVMLTEYDIHRNLHYRLREASTEYIQRVWHANRGRWLLRTPGPVPFGLAYVLLVETNPFPNLSLLLFEYPSVLSRFSFQSD